MDALYNHTFHHLDDAFKKLAAQVPPPQKVPHGDSFVFRYVEKTIQQAIVQKLARRYIARTRGLFMVLPPRLRQRLSAMMNFVEVFLITT